MAQRRALAMYEFEGRGPLSPRIAVHAAAMMIL